jgi:hypothetical protein
MQVDGRNSIAGKNEAVDKVKLVGVLLSASIKNKPNNLATYPIL